jgi:hypothetical protein
VLGALQKGRARNDPGRRMPTTSSRPAWPADTLAKAPSAPLNVGKAPSAFPLFRAFSFLFFRSTILQVSGRVDLQGARPDRGALELLGSGCPHRSFAKVNFCIAIETIQSFTFASDDPPCRKMPSALSPFFSSLQQIN